MNESDFKQRIIGAVVLIALGVIFIPILLNGEPDDGMPLFGSNIPERHKSITNMKPLNLGSNISPPDNKMIETFIVDALSPKIETQGKTSNKSESKSSTSNVVASEQKKNSSPLSQPEQSSETKIKSTVATGLQVTSWVIQVGSFTSKKNALDLQNKLRNKKYNAFVEAVIRKSKVSYRVRIGPEVIKKTSELTKKRLKKDLDINGIVMRHKG